MTVGGGTIQPGSSLLFYKCSCGTSRSVRCMGSHVNPVELRAGLSTIGNSHGVAEPGVACCVNRRLYSMTGTRDDWLQAVGETGLRAGQQDNSRGW